MLVVCCFARPPTKIGASLLASPHRAHPLSLITLYLPLLRITCITTNSYNFITRGQTSLRYLGYALYVTPSTLSHNPRLARNRCKLHSSTHGTHISEESTGDTKSILTFPRSVFLSCSTVIFTRTLSNTETVALPPCGVGSVTE